MKSELIKKENNEVTFTITLEAEEIEQQKIKVYQETKDQFEIDGFRKGKAPRSIIEKRYGKDIFTQQAVDELLNEKYPEAVKELDLEVIEAPRLTMEEGDEYVITATVGVYPEVTLTDYKGVEIEEVSGEVTEEEVDQEMMLMQQRNARIESVDEAAKEGDTVILDFEGSIDGELFEGGAAESYALKLGSGAFIPGFEEQLVGIKAGESRDVNVTFPEDYGADDLAGKDAVFKCTVHEVKVEELPELDDEFAKDVSEFDTLEELKADTKEKMGIEKAQSALAAMKEAVVRKIAEAAELPVPQGLLEQELNDMQTTMENQLRQQGLNLETYLQIFGKTMQEFRDDMMDGAKKRVENRMVVRAVADQEDFEIEQEAVDAQIADMAQQFGLPEDKIREIIEEENAGMIEKDLKMKKAIEFLYENAVIVPAKEEAAAEEE